MQKKVDERTIVLPIPPSVNHCYIRTRFGIALGAKGKAWKAEAYKEAKRQLEDWVVCNDKVILDIWVWWPNRRRRDLDNLMKLLGDSLNHAVYTDDRFAIPRFQDYGFDKVNPRIVIKVRRFEDDCIQPE